jgi:hypothetical protein
VGGTRLVVLGSKIVDEVARQFDIAVKNMSIHQTMPEDFLLLMSDEDAATKVFNDGKALRGPRFTLLFKKWSRFAHASASSLANLVDIEIRGIPEHAWSRSTAEHILRNSCWITDVHHNSGCGRDFASFWVCAWCLNPERVSRKLDLRILEPRDAIHEKRCLTYKIDISCRPVDLHPVTSATPPPAPFREPEDDQDRHEQDPHLRRRSDARADGDSRRPIQFRLGPRLPLGRAHDAHGSRAVDPLALRVLGIECDTDTAGRHKALPLRDPEKGGVEEADGGRDGLEVLTLRVARKDGHEETVGSQEMQSTSCMGIEKVMEADEGKILIPDIVGQKAVEKLNQLSYFCSGRSGGPRAGLLQGHSSRMNLLGCCFPLDPARPTRPQVI